MSKTYFGQCYEDTPKVIYARITNTADAAITQATLSTLTYRVDRYTSREDAVNCQDGSEVLGAQSLTIASTIFDTLQTGNGWPAQDTLGYNFKATIPPTAFPDSEDAEGNGYWYRVEVWCDPASGDDFLGGVWVFQCFATARA